MRRLPDRGRYDTETIRGILDEALICHVGFAVDGRPWVAPTAFARIDDQLYLHGAVGNFALRALAGGAEACITVTLLDGLVLARSAFHPLDELPVRHGLRAGRGGDRRGREEAAAVAVAAIVDQLVPGRTGDTRAPTAKELRATAKVRTGRSTTPRTWRSPPSRRHPAGAGPW